jgi:hypothetical protein
MIGPIPFGRRCGDDLPVGDADRASGLDELRLLEGEQLPPDEPGDGHPARQPDGDEDEEQAVHGLAERRVPKRDGQQDDEQEVRERIHDVRETHQDIIRPTPEPAGKRTDRHADQKDDDLDDDRHGHADPRTVHEPTEQVAADLVRAQDVAGGEGRHRLPVVGEDRRGILILIVVRGQERPEDGDEGHEDHHDKPDHRQSVLAEPRECVAPQACCRL